MNGGLGSTEWRRRRGGGRALIGGLQQELPAAADVLVDPDEKFWDEPGPNGPQNHHFLLTATEVLKETSLWGSDSCLVRFWSSMGPVLPGPPVMKFS